MSFKREQQAVKNSVENQKLDLQRQKMASQREIANKQLEIARVNKNRYDSKDSGKEKEKE